MRYGARPPFSLERLRRLPGGNIAYRIKKLRDGRAKLRVMTPLELLARLAAIVPPPRYPLLRYHGVLGPRSSWRRDVVPRPRAPKPCDLGGAAAKSTRTPAKTQSGPRGIQPSSPMKDSPPCDASERAAAAPASPAREDYDRTELAPRAPLDSSPTEPTSPDRPPHPDARRTRSPPTSGSRMARTASRRDQRWCAVTPEPHRDDEQAGLRLCHAHVAVEGRPRGARAPSGGGSVRGGGGSLRGELHHAAVVGPVDTGCVHRNSTGHPSP
jgi:hypothetical protein